ncbi:MAG: hypothetical protein BGO00_08900 [Alphaproteobacteria bacterium 62-8]|nr:MAG: hypothetical protein BGO00_08900 [Alphaproteobacteria bacterium 62-8]
MIARNFCLVEEIAELLNLCFHIRVLQTLPGHADKVSFCSHRLFSDLERLQFFPRQTGDAAEQPLYKMFYLTPKHHDTA